MRIAIAGARLFGTRHHPQSALTRHIVSLSIVTVLLAGCGSDDTVTGPELEPGPGNNDIGAFNVAVTGAESLTASGAALSGGTADESGWQLVLQETAQPFTSAELDSSSDRPANGTYTIVSVNEEAASNEYYFRITINNGIDTYYATSGTLTITSSSNDAVAGSFSCTAEESGGQTVSVEGTFRSTNLL